MIKYNIMSKIKSILQILLSLLRKIGIDPYKSYINYLQACVWKKSLPKKQLRTDGICLAFDVFQLTSFSQVGRDFIDKLAKTNIPFEVFDTDIGMSYSSYISEEEKEKYRKHLTPVIQQKRVLIFTVMPFKKSTKFTNALVPFWEFESGFNEARPNAFSDIQFIASPTDFCTNYFRKIAPPKIPVCKVRYPFPLGRKSTSTVEETRRKYGIKNSTFLAIFNFSYGSCYERKNPEGVLSAFATAFPGTEDACLIIKTAHSQIAKEKALKLFEKTKSLDISDKVIIVDDHMPHSDLINLFAASNVYISLHRGEGLGLGMLEAMSVGTPVVCTRYGGNLDFCNKDTAFLVDFCPQKPTTTIADYQYVEYWAEPDCEQAARYLRQIYENPETGKNKAIMATAFIEKFYDTNNFESEMRSVIKAMPIGN
jgi:glycosyltransferase involved in cell wall biosynthesis